MSIVEVDPAGVSGSGETVQIDGASATGQRPSLIVLPTYNERENVAALIARIVGINDDLHVLVIDDSSPDDTAEVVRALSIAEPRVHLVVRPGKLGLGSAYLLGFEVALASGFDGAVTMDADHSHDPAVIENMLALKRNGYELVIGSRYVRGGSVENWSALRRLNSFVANLLARRVVGRDVRDCTSGYRYYSAELLTRMKRIGLKSTGYSMLVELLYEARVTHAVIGEVPIQFRDRVAGLSKISGLEVVESLWTLVRLKIRQVFYGKRL